MIFPSAKGASSSLWSLGRMILNKQSKAVRNEGSSWLRRMWCPESWLPKNRVARKLETLMFFRNRGRRRQAGGGFELLDGYCIHPSRRRAFFSCMNASSTSQKRYSRDLHLVSTDLEPNIWVHLFLTGQAEEGSNCCMESPVSGVSVPLDTAVRLTSWSQRD